MVRSEATPTAATYWFLLYTESTESTQAGLVLPVLTFVPCWAEELFDDEELDEGAVAAGFDEDEAPELPPDCPPPSILSRAACAAAWASAGEAPPELFAEPLFVAGEVPQAENIKKQQHKINSILNIR
jgi:hypothetical protein